MINPGALSGQASELRLMAGVVILFLAAATIASWVPARHARRIDPIVVLKE
jgi:ABC-type antimicrobial peptide transport system permease subunit